MMGPWAMAACGAAAVVAAGVLVACRAQGGVPSEVETPRTMPQETFLVDAISGVTEERVVVLRTPDELRELHGEHARLNLPPRPAPDFDFGERMLVAVFAGSRPSSGYGVEVELVEWRPDPGGGVDGVLRVRAKEARPAPGMMGAQVMTSPTHWVSVPTAPGAVELEWAPASTEE